MNKISEKKVKELIKELKNINSLKESKRKTHYWYNQKRNVVDSDNIPTDLIKQFLDEYNRVKKTIERIETDDRAITNVERNENGDIEYYTFEIFRKNNPTFSGKLTTKEMETIYKLYSVYGANLTQKLVSREFPQYTFVEFKRILRAFNIYKCGSEFPQHMLEQYSEEELINLHNQNKENNVLRRIEKDQLSEANKLINKLAKENQEYKNQLSSISNINVKIDNGYKPVKKDKINSTTKLNIYLADMHIGSKCESNSLYPNQYDYNEISRRLNTLYGLISDFGLLDEIIITLMGDSLDGMDSQTARRDHILPQNMDNMEQLEAFIELTSGFILSCQHLANKVTVYSVKCGNHGGMWEYTANLALQNVITKIAPDIRFTLFKDFIGYYRIYDHIILPCHGKDEKFMKRGLPLNMDERTKIMLYEWMEANDISGENIHFVKGDLHSNALNSCKRFDYRNVLSLYGASDYSNYNFSRNSYGVSYDLYVGNSRTIGTFENF